MSYEDYYKLKLEEHKDEIEEISTSIDIDWKQKQLQKFEEYVKREYRKYLEQYGIGDISTSNKLKAKFITEFLKRSINNIIPAKISYYFILSLIAKGLNNISEYKIKLSDKQIFKVDPIIHIFWSQQSSSGKSQAIDFLRELIKVLSDKLKSLYDLGDDFFRVYNIDWTETPQAFINHFEISYSKGKQSYNFDKVVKGIFESYDVLFSEESAYLLKEKVKDKQTVSELLLLALEGKEIDKTLVGWNGKKTTTRPKFLFYGVSRPVAQLPEGFLEKGLFQRMLAYFKDITTEEIKKTSKMLVENFFDKIDFEGLSEELVDVYKWRISVLNKKYQNTFLVWDKEKFLSYIQTKMDNIRDYVSKEVQSWTVKEIMNAFISRYYLKLSTTLFVLESISRRKVTITEDVVTEVYELLDSLITSLMVFTERHVVEKRLVRVHKKRIIQLLNKYFYINKQSNFEDDLVKIIDFLRIGMKLSTRYIEDMLKRLEEDNIVKITGSRLSYTLPKTIKKK